MEVPRTLTIKMLANIFDQILLKLKDQQVNEVTLNVDMYRIIPTDEWQKFDEDVIVVGSIYDDFDSLQLVLQNPDRPFTYIDFDRTASLLRAISEILNPVNDSST